MTKSYIYADAQPLAQHDYDAGTAGMYFYLHDRLGSVRALIDDSAAIVNSYTYEPFGELVEESTTHYNPLTFTGRNRASCKLAVQNDVLP